MVEDHQGDGERIVAEDLGGDRLGRADDRAFGREALGEQPVELLEQVDVLLANWSKARTRWSSPLSCGRA